MDINLFPLISIPNIFNQDPLQRPVHYKFALTKEDISKNLKLSNYCGTKEEGEVCVICQVEFENKETLGVLRCKHQYHPECIKGWLIRQNVCPLCKAQGLKITLKMFWMNLLNHLVQKLILFSFQVC
ncbi:putative transcription factor C2H2 family [Helianthus anomalus]